MRPSHTKFPGAAPANGQCIGVPLLSQDFRQRAQLYADWDRRLRAQTRFFAAAAVTNALLADLLSRFGGRWYLSGATLESLAHLGLRLERLNLALAQGLLSQRKWLSHCAAAEVEDLDRTMVELEQRTVQRWLGGRLARDRQRHDTLIRQMDGLLRIVGFQATPARLCRNGAIYAQVLRIVGARLGRPASFAHQEDRICIGRALIRQVRCPEGLLSKQTVDRYHVRSSAARGVPEGVPAGASHPLGNGISTEAGG